jgi:hypothetical protein
VDPRASAHRETEVLQAEVRRLGEAAGREQQPLGLDRTSDVQGGPDVPRSVHAIVDLD